MFWFNNNKKIESDINDLNVVERYEDKEENDLSDKINNVIIKEDLSEMLYIEDDLLLML
jgi:hypothetical protein